MSFNSQYQLAQDITGDTSASQLVKFKRDINKGGARFLNRLGRKFNKEYITTNLVDGQQYYQMSMGVLRISTIKALNGTVYYTPTLVTSEEEWNELNAITFEGSVPTHYYIRGFNEIGLYPIPSANVTDGLKASFEPQHVVLTAADYTTGTVTVADGSVTVTHSATGFTPQMVGRSFQVTDGTDGRWYRISAYVSTSELTLENYYEGISGAGRTFSIGEVMKIPMEYEDTPVYWALNLYYLSKCDKASAKDYLNMFNDDIKEAKSTYGRSTSQMGVKKGKTGRRASWIELTPAVTYP